MRILMLTLVLLFLSACGTSHDKTGEAVLIDSEQLKVKVVQIYDDMPWHYYGLKHEIWCQSPKTMDMALGQVERGWNVLSHSILSEPGQSPSDAIKKKSLDAATMEAKKHLRVINDEIVAYGNNGIFTMSIDACQRFFIWSSWVLPADSVVQADKPKYCKEGECQWENFKGDNEISYSDIRIDTTSKNISFHARSKAFKDGELLVQSEDGGRHWGVTKLQRKKTK